MHFFFSLCSLEWKRRDKLPSGRNREREGEREETYKRVHWKKKIVICVARASMVLFSLGEINKNIPGNFERSLTSNTLYQHLCKSPSPQVTQAWIRIPFNPTFRTFHWSNETECIFNWSDRNIGDQLWRWSTLTRLVGPNWQNCCPQYRSFVSSLLTWLNKSLVYRHVVFGSVMTSQSMLLQIGYIMYICTLKIQTFYLKMV